MKHLTKNIFALIVIFFHAALSGTAHGQTIVNGSFEQPALAASSFSYAPTGSNWNFSGTSGISASNSGFSASSPEAPSGKQIAFIQHSSSISQTVYLVPGSILTFSASQRVNYGSAQTLGVSVNGIPQYFTLGNPTGRVTSGTVTPPSNYYTTYSINLNGIGVNYYADNTLTIYGTVTDGDATAFIDSVAISTPTSRSYGLWDPGFSAATVRSDQPVNTNIFSTGPCLYTTLGAEQIAPAGATPYGNSFPGTNTPCFQTGGSTYAFPTVPASNWASSSDYVPGNPYWTLGMNDEFLPWISCTGNSGPPNQNRPLVRAGAPGPSISINSLNAASDPAIGNHNLVSLLYNQDTGNSNCYGIPYISVSANTNHGNGLPIAVLDSAGYHRSHLKFNASVFSATPSTTAIAWLVIQTSGWADNVNRMLQIEIMASPNAKIDGVGPSPILKKWWNWNIKNSAYYPGAILNYWTASQVNSACGMTIPTLSTTNTYVASGHSPTSISNYDIDLHALINCMNQQGAWGGSSNQLPDPLVITNVEWAIETVEYIGQNHIWVGFWNPQIQ